MRINNPEIPGILGARHFSSNRFVVVRAILSAVSPLLELGVAGALLAVLGTGLSGSVVAAGETQKQKAQASLTDPSVLRHKDDHAAVLRGNIALYGAKTRQAKGNALHSSLFQAFDHGGVNRILRDIHPSRVPWQDISHA